MEELYSHPSDRITGGQGRRNCVELRLTRIRRDASGGGIGVARPNGQSDHSGDFRSRVVARRRRCRSGSVSPGSLNDSQRFRYFVRSLLATKSIIWELFSERQTISDNRMRYRKNRHRMNPPWWVACALLAVCLATFSAGSIPAQSPAGINVSTHRATLQRYCLSCHTQ